MSSEDSEGAPKSEAVEGKAPLPEFKELARLDAEQQLRDVLTPAIVEEFMKGKSHIDFCSHPDALVIFKATLQAKGYTIEDLAEGPAPPGQPPRPGIRLYLHGLPGSVLPNASLPDLPRLGPRSSDKKPKRK